MRNIAAAVVMVGLCCSCADRPRTTLWVWERAENLKAADPSTMTFAVLSKTIFLNRDQVTSRPRLRPVNLPEGAKTVAVVRIEAEPDFDVDTTRVTKELIAATPRTASGLQIDFDARHSERPFYTELLHRVRQELPRGKSLSITALASWCFDDPWIRDLPIDDAVPMLFRMGVDSAHVRSRLKSGRDFTLAMCRNSLGLSLDEPVTNLPAGRRLYVFAPKPWDTESLAAVRNLGVMP